MLLLQKTYTVDFLSKKRVKNNGIVPQYYVEGSHEAIIPRDLYMQVQEEMARRANLHSGSDRKKRVYSSKYALSSIVYYVPGAGIFTAESHGTTGASTLRCALLHQGGTWSEDAPTIQESDLQDAVARAINNGVLGGREVFPSALEENIEAVIGGRRG